MKILIADKMPASGRARLTENGTCGNKSSLLITTTWLVRNALGYLPGLSSPSVVLSTITRTCSPSSCDAGQIRLPTSSMNRKSNVRSPNSGNARSTSGSSR